ncbi:hypothetical protein LWH48_16395 [Halomonas sp. G15]|uniref:Uncharacterized protein n=1 Tax=Halomonas alimentaria TaxID=147248 RepID=A0A7X4W4U1_9GAMM|nr:MULTISPECIES: hypothetical protein [Halomonas]MCE0734345.1 hypothetical protein [Halomonas sp. G15]NAW34334.1 hypothetical protein [Halomonas alimentaria]
MTLADTLVTENRAIVPLLLIGLALLALGVLAAGWEPIELPLGLAALGTLALVLLTPERWQDEEARDTVNSLVLASLITLAGFHVMA